MITKNNSGMQMSKRNSLYEEMKKFQKEKKLYFFVLSGVGLLGLIFPVIPGMFLIGLGITLISPKHGEALLNRIKKWFKSLA